LFWSPARVPFACRPECMKLVPTPFTSCSSRPLPDSGRPSSPPKPTGNGPFFFFRVLGVVAAHSIVGSSLASLFHSMVPFPPHFPASLFLSPFSGWQEQSGIRNLFRRSLTNQSSISACWLLSIPLAQCCCSWVPLALFK